jgi:Insertion element 4 transposase N-terminal/Transposase DDE domain
LPAYRATALPADAIFPLTVIGEVVEAAGVRERRRRLLPAAAVMVFVLGCCLFSGDSYREVARRVAWWMELACGRAGWRVPGAPALARARRRLGWRPFELLFARLAGPLAGPGTPGATAFGRLLAAIDGSTLEVPYSPANAQAFGSPPTGHGRGGYPQVRLVTMTGCGTRGLMAAAFGKAKGKGGGETTLALQIAAAGAPGPGTLVLADRVFCGYPLVAALTGAHADVLIRAKSDLNLPACQVLTDGSWLSVLPDPKAAHLRSSRNCTRRRRGSQLGPDTSPLPGITIRVIEFTLTVTSGDGSHRSEPYRLITTLLDPAQAPAHQLAECYAQRWEAETGYRELKTALKGSGRILRSKDPGMVRQEIWALLSACQLIHAARAATAKAGGADLDPDRISYTVTLRALRRHITAGHRKNNRRTLTREILGQLLPRRRQRSYPRLTRASTALRRQAAAQHHGPVSYRITINTPASATSQPGP